MHRNCKEVKIKKSHVILKHNRKGESENNRKKPVSGRFSKILWIFAEYVLNE